MRTEQPKAIYLKDYQAPEYLIDETHLTFELFEDHTLVHAQLVMRRNPERGAGLSEARMPPLVLDGQQLELLSISLDDRPLTAADDPESICHRQQRAHPPGKQHGAGRAVPVRHDVLYPVRGRRFPQDHLLP